MDTIIIPSAAELNSLIDLDCQEYILLFRASRDGFSGDTFHKQCNNQGPTLTVIKAKDDSVFGG